MQIFRINTNLQFGMAKNPAYDHKKEQLNGFANQVEAGSPIWFAYKQVIRDTITQQLKNDRGLTEQDRKDLEREAYLIDTDVYNHRRQS